MICVPFAGPHVPEGMEDYETFLEDADGEFDYPEIDENQAASMCFTSGTTGKPKGVVYSHRALVLHSLAACLSRQLWRQQQRRDPAGVIHVPCERMGRALRGRDDGSEARISRARTSMRRACSN